MSLGVLVQEHPPRRVHPAQRPHAQTERGSNDRGLHRAWSSPTPLSGAPASCALATPQASGAPSPRPSRRVDVPSDASAVRDPDNHALAVAAVDRRPEIGRRINGPARSVGCRSLHQSRAAISPSGDIWRPERWDKGREHARDQPRLAQFPKYIAESLFESESEIEGLGPTTRLRQGGTSPSRAGASSLA